MYCPICDQKPMNCDCTPEERRMHAEIEDLEEQVPRWIPVRERLPESGVRVLIFCPLAEPNEVAAAVLRHEGMWRMDDGEVYGESEPTHWMPLPERPTGNE